MLQKVEACMASFSLYASTLDFPPPPPQYSSRSNFHGKVAPSTTKILREEGLDKRKHI